MSTATFPLWRLVAIGAAPVIGLLAILALPGVTGIVVGLGVITAALLLLAPLLDRGWTRAAAGALVAGYIVVIAGVLLLSH